MPNPEDILPPEEDATTLQTTHGERLWSDDALTLIKPERPNQSAPTGKVFWLIRFLEEKDLAVVMALFLQRTQINARDFGRFTPDDPALLQSLQKTLAELLTELGLTSLQRELAAKQLWPLR